MGSHHQHLSVAIFLLLAAGAAGYPWEICGTVNTFDRNSTFQANFNRLATSLPRNASASRDLYATAVAGAVPDRIWAMALCRGDVNATVCLDCLTQAFSDVQTLCSFYKDATIYYNPCMLHYSDVHTLPTDDAGPMSDAYINVNNENVTTVPLTQCAFYNDSTIHYYPCSLHNSDVDTLHADDIGPTNNGNATSDPARYKRDVAALLNATADYAAFNSTRRFATGEADFNQEFPKLYSYAQCPPDQPPARCRRCLARIIEDNLQAMWSHIGGRVLWVNCTYRFETQPFYNGPAMVRLASLSSRAPAPTPANETPSATGEGGRKYDVPVVVLAAVLAVEAASNLVACLYFWRRRQRKTAESKKPYPKYAAEAEDAEMMDSMMMDVSTLRAATGDFDESNKLGEGRFGVVYKGVLSDGKEIAVKRLSQSSTQGVDEMKNELALVAKLKHKNLVRLAGVYLDEQERLLVYEFVPNRSLELVLFGTEDENGERHGKAGQLSWEQRYRIINGVARGLQYLHEDSQLRVVHRDLKASNILLDANMNPKISDFGLARIFGRDQTQAVTSRVVGTYGYMAPEYVMRGNYSVKSDAFSFGVIVLEIVTGRKNNDSDDAKQSGDLLNTVWERWEAGTVMELVDPSMDGSFPGGDQLRCIHIALLCVQADPAARPVMSSVVMMLGSDTVALPAPSKPAFFARKGGSNATAVSTVSLQG